MWLSPQALEAVLDHCRRESPREACGWLGGRWDPPDGPAAGRRGVVAFGLRAYPMRNVAADPVRRYLMDPEEQFAVLRALRRQGDELVAIYHSHPKTPPVPSTTDVELAYTKDVMYLIVSLAKPRPALRAWWLDCDTRRVEEVAVRWDGGDIRGYSGGMRWDGGTNGAGGGEGDGGERSGTDHYRERQTPHLSR